MSSFILQLFIISAFGLMAQSAPVNDVTKRSTDNKEMDQRRLERSLYCAAESLYHERLKVNFALPSLPQDDIDNTGITKTIANKIFVHFSDRCKNFTKAMTLKHQLQEHLFSNDSSVVLNSDNVKILSIALIGLQSVAKIFNDLELNENNSRCVKLTPAQYRIMYYALYTALLLESWEVDIDDSYRSNSRPLYTLEGIKHCK